MFGRRQARGPVDPDHLRRRPDRQTRYRGWNRLADSWHGQQDGAIDLCGLRREPVGTLTVDTSPWLAGNHHRELERHEQETLAHQADSATVRIRYTAALADLEVALAALDEARQERDEVVPPTEADLARRGPAEARASDQVVRARRAREHAERVVAPTLARVQLAQRQVDALNAELHGLVGTLDALERITHTRQVRISEHHAMRAATYQQSYLRRVLREDPRWTQPDVPSGPPTT